MVVLVWLILGVVLLAVEMRHLAFYALFGAAGAFAAAIVAAIAPSAYPAQVAVAVLVAAIGMVAVRPMVSDAMHRRFEGRLGRGVHGTLIGEEVMTLDVIGDIHQVGHVKLVGERWLAVSGSGFPIAADTRVLVTAVEGTTLTVWPVDGISRPLVEGLNAGPESPPEQPPAESPPTRAEGDHP
jgi:membrane protein implicated in regulation of membrane protease activity